FYERVKHKALQYGDYYFNPAKAHPTDSSSLVKPHSTLNSEKVAVLDANRHNLIATPGFDSLKIPLRAFETARQNKFSFINHGYSESVIYYVKNERHEGFIVSSAYDKFGRRKIDNLRLIMLATL